MTATDAEMQDALTRIKGAVSRQNTVPEILDAAANIIEERGWHQGDFFDYHAYAHDAVPRDECAVCAGGAVNVAADYAPDVTEPHGVLRDALEFFVRYVDPEFSTRLDEYAADLDFDHCDEPDLYDAIAGWNDDPDRTADDVVNALRAAASQARQVRAEADSGRLRAALLEAVDAVQPDHAAGLRLIKNETAAAAEAPAATAGETPNHSEGTES